MDKVKEIIKKIIANRGVQLGFIIVLMTASLLTLDGAIRNISNQYQYFYDWQEVAPWLFSLSWIFLFEMLLFLIPQKWRRACFLILLISFNILVIAQYLHLLILDRFFGIYDLFLVGEGANYFGTVLKSINGTILWPVFISLALGIGVFILMKRQTEFTRGKAYYISILVVGLLLTLIPKGIAISCLGKASTGTTYRVATNVRNVYNDFNNPSKNMEVAGLYEKTFREIYLYIGTLFDDKKEAYYAEAKDYFENKKPIPSTNDKTGVFKDKNLVFIMLESVDSWLVTEELMPTLYDMEQTGWNFTNRYAPSFGGGATFNTEFAANTGIYSLNNGMPAYNFNHNHYPYALPRLFQDDGYLVQSVHANNGTFYNRKSIHESLGYLHHYALRDMHLTTDKNYFEDDVLASDDQIYRYIVPDTDQKFMSFVITYTGHMPYSNENNKCDTDPYQLAVEGDEALSCIRNLVRHTDEFLRILKERLAEENKLDDTIFVIFSDHYAYAYPDLNYVYDQKGTKDLNLLQHIPFVIWGNNLDHEEVGTIMDTADILPTVANLFGLSKYDANNYLATDVFSPNHDPYVYFPNASWYDGTTYYKGNDDQGLNSTYIENISNEVIRKMKINDALLLGDYYR